MEITAREVLDLTGQVTAVVSILHDLTEIRELERRRVEQRRPVYERSDAPVRLVEDFGRKRLGRGLGHPENNRTAAR